MVDRKLEMKKTMRVSIITVTYNVSKTIRQTIDSVLSQSYSNIEYILVDGMSVDGTWEIIQAYKKQLACIIHEQDKGLYDAMNKGISRSTGDIIGIINGDDWYEPDAVKKVVECFNNQDVDIVYGDMWVHGANGGVKRSCDHPIEDIWCYMVSHPTIFVRRDCYERFGFFNLDYRIAADYDLILRFYVNGCRFYHMDTVLCDFRLGGLSQRRALECGREVNRISLSYIQQCPDKEKYQHLIEDRYKSTCDACLALGCEKEKEKILSFLQENFEENAETVIFGTGRWGNRCYALLNKMDCHINGWVDNDSSKWNTNLEGVKVFAPKNLYKEEWNVILAVNDYKHEIAGQLENIKSINPKLNWVNMMDFGLL